MTQLLNTIEHDLSKTQIGADRWYLLAIACLVAGPDPESAAQLYGHLTNQPRYQTSDARKALVRRLREALIKSVCLVGACKPIEAIVAISKLERPEDRDYSITRQGWQADAANHERGLDWFGKVYTRDQKRTISLFDAHRDFAWVSEEITYGLYLSDRQVLDDVDTETIVVAAIMSQNLPNETHWHIRGLRRIGVSKEDAQVAWEAIARIAAHFGVSLGRVPTVDAVESDV